VIIGESGVVGHWYTARWHPTLPVQKIVPTTLTAPRASDLLTIKTTRYLWHGKDRRNQNKMDDDREMKAGWYTLQLRKRKP